MSGPRYLDLLLLLDKIEEIEKSLKKAIKKNGKTLRKKDRTAQYKWIKHIYAELDEIKARIKALEDRVDLLLKTAGYRTNDD